MPDQVLDNKLEQMQHEHEEREEEEQYEEEYEEDCQVEDGNVHRDEGEFYVNDDEEDEEEEELLDEEGEQDKAVDGRLARGLTTLIDGVGKLGTGNNDNPTTMVNYKGTAVKKHVKPPPHSSLIHLTTVFKIK